MEQVPVTSPEKVPELVPAASPETFGPTSEPQIPPINADVVVCEPMPKVALMPPTPAQTPRLAPGPMSARISLMATVLLVPSMIIFMLQASFGAITPRDCRLFQPRFPGPGIQAASPEFPMFTAALTP